MKRKARIKPLVVWGIVNSDREICLDFGETKETMSGWLREPGDRLLRIAIVPYADAKKVGLL